MQALPPCVLFEGVGVVVPDAIRKLFSESREQVAEILTDLNTAAVAAADPS